MSSSRKAVLLVGSPRGHRSTSDSLGTYLLDQLKKKGFSIEKNYIYPSLRTDETVEQLLDSVQQADIAILSFPLYFDSLPSNVIKTLELIRDFRLSRKHRSSHSTMSAGTRKKRKQQFMAIANCSLPEAAHNDIALAICRNFALEASFEWVGGLSLGEGDVIGGQCLARLNALVRNVTQSLSQTADSLAKGETITQEAASLFARPLLPIFAYTWFSELNWKHKAKVNCALGSIYSRPYNATQAKIDEIERKISQG